MDFARLYSLSGTAIVERLGKVQDGERLKIEFRGTSAPGSPIEGKAHGTTWVLVGPLQAAATNAVQEVTTPAKERVVLELRGYTTTLNGDGMEVRACGIIRSSAGVFAHLNGHIALVVQKIAADNAVTIEAYQF